MEGESAVEEKVRKHVTRILCVLSAIILWLFVTYTEDPEMQLWVRGVPISYTGAQELYDRGITFVQQEEPETVGVKISGRKSVLRRLSASNIHASVNYASIGDAGTHTLPIQVSLPENALRVTKLSVESVSCRTDVLVTVDKTVTITSSGAESLGIHDFSAYPSTIQLTGPKAVLDTLKAAVYVDLTGGDAAESYTVSLSDQTGNRYDGNSVSIANDKVTISATRSLPVKIEAASVPENKTIREVVCTPETADVRGELSALLEADAVEGAYTVWVDFASSPAKSGQVRLSYPENVEVLGPASASATFHFE